MGKFDPDRLKTQLKLAKCRLENLLKQHRNSSGGRRQEISDLLRSGHEDRARVKVSGSKSPIYMHTNLLSSRPCFS